MSKCVKNITYFDMLSQKKDKDGYVEHLICNGSRFHVISYSSLGMKCSCKNCEINKPQKGKYYEI